MGQVFKNQRRVSWKDTDAAGIVHFSNFFAFMEETEHALLREIGLEVRYANADGEFSWPRIAASCDYKSPARFGDLLDIDAQIAEIRSRTVIFDYYIRQGERLCAVGRLTIAHCMILEDGIKSHPMPREIVDKLKPFLVEPPQPDV